MRAVALVTGASSGIGADLARVFARHGHDLALTGRDAGRLDALAAELVETGRPRPIVVAGDLAERDGADRIAAALDAHDARVVVLVNNAGFGLIGPVDGLDRDNQVAIVDVNVRALLDLTLRVLPDLKAARGKILNVGSIVGYMPGPGMAAYYASKAFVSSWSRALGQELKGAGVTVTLLNPGVTQTEFHTRATAGRRGAAAAAGATSMSVAEAGYAGLMAGRRVVVPGLRNKLAAAILPFAPDALLLPLMHRAQTRRR